MKKELTLGMEVKDRVTGYKGIAIAETVYMQGCSRILVQPKLDKDGKIPEAQTFDEPDLEIVSYGILPQPKPKPKENGGPRPMASRHSEPSRR